MDSITNKERAEMISFMNRLFYNHIHNGVLDCYVTLDVSQFKQIIRIWPDIYFQPQITRKLSLIDRFLRREPEAITFRTDRKWLEEIRNDWLFTQTFLLHGYTMHVEVTHG